MQPKSSGTNLQNSWISATFKLQGCVWNAIRRGKRTFRILRFVNMILRFWKKKKKHLHYLRERLVVGLFYLPPPNQFVFLVRSELKHNILYFVCLFHAPRWSLKVYVYSTRINGLGRYIYCTQRLFRKRAAHPFGFTGNGHFLCLLFFFYSALHTSTNGVIKQDPQDCGTAECIGCENRNAF